MNSSLIILALLLSTSTSYALHHHLDPETTPQEYEKLLQLSKNQKFFDRKENSIENAISYGERLNEWIKVINHSRPTEMQIRLTTAQNRGAGVPIERPYIYSVKIIEEKLKEIKLSMPIEMGQIIFEKAPYSKDYSIPDSVFIEHGRKLYGIYSMAARYKLLNPNRELYVGQERRDVRGYYYLTKNKIDAEALKAFPSFAPKKKEEVIDALIKICQNDWKSRKSCQKKVEASIRKGTLPSHYHKYFPKAQKNWDTFFKIKKEAKRKDLIWSDSQSTLPFRAPKSRAVQEFILKNISEEYRLGDWNLELQFGNHGPYLVFAPGVTPHVNKLGGDQIVMDANASLNEFDSQWTLRHEFGHVLGLPDCYHEFYDTKIEAFVNYQIDVTDLMCSRSGNMNERIYQELKKTYQR